MEGRSEWGRVVVVDWDVDGGMVCLRWLTLVVCTVSESLGVRRLLSTVIIIMWPILANAVLQTTIPRGK